MKVQADSTDKGFLLANQVARGLYYREGMIPSRKVSKKSSMSAETVFSSYTRSRSSSEKLKPVLIGCNRVVIVSMQLPQ